MTLRKRPRSGTGSPKVLFGENKASSRPLISGAVRNAVYGPGGAVPAALTAEYLVVAGGGGSGVGGGGAGGYQEGTLDIALSTPYAVTVGAGGTANTNPYSLDNAQPGASSTFNVTVSAGGGKGGGHNDPGGNGGSGGGTGSDITSGAGAGNTPPTTPAQGFNGGASNRLAYGAGGGGGGATTRGFDATTGSASVGHGGDGGQAKASSITGTTVYYAGGGGGGCNTNTVSATGGGLGGRTTVTAEKGGAGDGTRLVNGAGSNGVANTGGGAGGAEVEGPNGGNGGSGVVIIRVPSTVVAEFSAGVVYNYIPLDDFNVYEITAAGVSDTVTFSQGAVTTVGESLLFNDNDSARLTRTPSVVGDRKTWTWSAWVKRGNLSTGVGYYGTLFGALGGSTETIIEYEQDNKIEVRWYSGGYALQVRSSAIYRDSSAWYHIVVAIDTTQATASNRAKLYVNGKQVTALTVATYPAQNSDMDVNNTVGHGIGMRADAIRPFDGYMSDVYLIDGEALDPSRFGKQDADGIWQPISYTGSYGTNGFHLEFADNSTAAALGTDTSGNGNNWTPSGITTDDQVTDTPSVNWPTFGLDRDETRVSLYDGNLQAFCSLQGIHRATFGVDSGKWYWEVYTYSAANLMTGIATAKANIASYLGVDTYGYAYFQDGRKFNVTSSSYGTTWGAGTIIGVAFDADNWTLEFFNNGTSQGVAFTGITPDIYFPAGGHSNGNGLWNFGQRPFAYTPPTGFQALNSSNLPAPTITDGKAHFQPALYTGNGTTQAIGGLEFQPDLVWIKNRDAGYSHWWQDAVRGAQKQLNSDNTNAENSYGNVLASFDTNGFTVNSSVGVNAAGQRHVAWNWYAGGSTVTNTDGTIPSQVRANTDAGFSIVSYTGTGAAATVGHGLGAAPSMVIIKNRIDGTRNWGVYHKSVGNGAAVFLDLSNAAITNAAYWNNTSPTSSVFSVANSDATNGPSDAMIAYCFAGVDGFSKFGSYTGNGSADGPFVYTGFRPAFVIMKSNTNGYYWVMKDNKRAAAYNPVTGNLYPNDLLVEDTTATAYIDLLANGFKLRGNYLGTNGSGVGYIFMAFAENPFKTARAR